MVRILPSGPAGNGTTVLDEARFGPAGAPPQDQLRVHCHFAHSENEGMLERLNGLVDRLRRGSGWPAILRSASVRTDQLLWWEIRTLAGSRPGPQYARLAAWLEPSAATRPVAAVHRRPAGGPCSSSASGG